VSITDTEIIIIGAGISGLTSAFYLQDRDFIVLEAGDYVGGKIETVKKDGYLLENGPNSLFLRTYGIKKLIADLGLDEDNIGDLDQGVLTDILLYHVKKGRVYAEEVVYKEQIRTMFRDFVYVGE